MQTKSCCKPCQFESSLLIFFFFFFFRSRKTSSNIDENLNLVLLVVDQSMETLLLNLIELDNLGDHLLGSNESFGNGIDNGLEITQLECSTRIIKLARSSRRLIRMG